MTRAQRILVDLDGVLADWGRAYGEELDKFGFPASLIPRHAEQRGFDLNLGRTKAERDIIAQVMVVPGFYARLEPIEGGVQALKEMLIHGHHVNIVTSPWASNPTCASDKLNWVIQHFGSHWAKRVVITSDKTLVQGDILIDDKPAISGSVAPTWEHVLFDQPYNRDVTKRRLVDWGAWRQVLDGYHIAASPEAALA